MKYNRVGTLSRSIFRAAMPLPRCRGRHVPHEALPKEQAWASPACGSLCFAGRSLAGDVISCFMKI